METQNDDRSKKENAKTQRTGGVAQWLEHPAHTRSVEGSNPPAATIKTNVSSLLADLEQLLRPQNLSSKD